MHFSTQIRRAYVRSFWLTASLLAAIGSAGALVPRVGLPWIAAGIVVSIAIAALGFYAPLIAKGPCKLWMRSVDLYCRVTRLAVKAICFFVVFVLVGRTKSSLLLARPVGGGSVWHKRDTLTASTYPYESENITEKVGPLTWRSAYMSWCHASGNRWAVLLLPYLLLLDLLEPEQERALPANIYTLF